VAFGKAAGVCVQLQHDHGGPASGAFAISLVQRKSREGSQKERSMHLPLAYVDRLRQLIILWHTGAILTKGQVHRLGGLLLHVRQDMAVNAECN
jgi:hypothetical protein